MDFAKRELRQELEMLVRIKFELEEQDALLMESMQRARYDAIASAHLDILENIFREINDLRLGVMQFVRNDDVASLRPQIRSARAKVDGRIKALQPEPQMATHQMPSLSAKDNSLDRRKVFVVHGRNMDARNAIFDFLARIDLSPIEWEEAIAMTASASPSTLSAIDRAFSKAQAAVVILSGDDLARLRGRYLSDQDGPHEHQLTPQARPNVIFEAGMAFGMFPKRTVIVSFGKTRPISDIDGINILYLSDSPESRKKLAGRLKTAGCDVDTENKVDWIKAGDFQSALHHPEVLDRPQHRFKVVRRELQHDPGAEVKRKIWIEIRNDGESCPEVRFSRWKHDPVGIDVDGKSPTLQIKLGRDWCPAAGIERLKLPTGESCQTWIKPDDKYSIEELQRRCRVDTPIGSLVLLLDGAEVEVVA
jgi:predicted nucleotide-binding protein